MQGRLPDGQEVAVKMLSKHSSQGDLECKTEVMLVAKLHHRNLVRLLGFCLVSDSVSNKIAFYQKAINWLENVLLRSLV